MFWKKKDRKPPKPPAERIPLSREQILAQAKANAAAARAEIGDETLERIKEAMLRKQASAIEQAKAKILAADEGKVRDHLQYMLREKDER
ncbi:MAG: hypothetical protein WC989_07195 [Micavibrio sp.]